MVQGSGFLVQGTAVWMYRPGCGAQGAGLTVLGSGRRVKGGG